MIFENDDYIIICDLEGKDYIFTFSNPNDFKEKFRFCFNKKDLKKFAEFLSWVAENK